MRWERWGRLLGRPGRSGQMIRLGAAGLGVLVLLATLGVIGYRVFAPHETLTRPSEPYPAAGAIVDERPFSELRAAPLVVDGRLRVYAEKWRIWSDGPVGGRYEATPYWALRRWPAQVVGVVSVAAPTGPVVVTQWSDGELVALDARSGRIAWRAAGPAVERGYDGRRTGASVVYEPEALLTAQRPGGAVVIAIGSGSMRAFDALTGAGLWDRPQPTDCHPWTADALVAVPGCADSLVTFIDAASGIERSTWTAPGGEPVVPSQCALGRSGCRLLIAGPATFRVGGDDRPHPIPTLPEGALLAGDLVVYPSPAGVTARPLAGGPTRWTWSGQGRLVTANEAGVYLLTGDLTVLALDPARGSLKSVGCAAITVRDQWQLGHVYPAENGEYLAIERLSGAAPTSADKVYYFGLRPMALVELYPPSQLPVWPGKFAACRPL
ncbi:MAG: PQQ-binding-like beta-propeller repeat protein [Micromonosporaceae bacterium]